MLRPTAKVVPLLVFAGWAACKAAPDPCTATVPCDVNYAIEDADHLAAVQACGTIEGYLDLDGEGFGRVDLPCLEAIEGALLIDIVGKLDHFDMKGLESVGWNFDVWGTGQSPTLEALSGLRTVGGDMTISRTGYLASLDELSSLESVGGRLYIGCNWSLSDEDAAAFASSIEVGGPIVVEYNGSDWWSDYICNSHGPIGDDDDYTPSDDDDDDDDDSSVCTGEDVDCDGDGWTPAAGDCDDGNPAAHPGAVEYCDWVDNDCDGVQDSGCFTQLSAGSAHTCGLQLSGETECWGSNTAAQASPSTHSWFTEISSGTGHGCGLASQVVHCWGCEFADETMNHGQCEVPSGWHASVEAGAYHTCALDWDGLAECWGYNEHGQSEPIAAYFQHVALGTYHSCGLTTSGVIRCWGCNDEAVDFGQCSHSQDDFIQIECGLDFTCGIRTDGSVDCWGADTHGQSSPPQEAFAEIAIGSMAQFACGRAADGRTLCWGNPLGDATTPPSTDFVSLTAGSGHVCGLTETGEAECWGLNWDGQCNVPAP